MIKHLLAVLLFFSLILLAAGCKKEEPPFSGPYLLDPEYEGCCTGMYTGGNIVLNGVAIYQPNVFTPNGDGINDVFLPSFDESVTHVTAYEIYNSSGVQMYRLRYPIPVQFFELYAWDGVNRNNNQLHKGEFYYNLRVISTLGIRSSSNVRACSILCDEGSSGLLLRDSCYYGTQVLMPGVGHLDLPHFEENCLEY